MTFEQAQEIIQLLLTIKDYIEIVVFASILFVLYIGCKVGKALLG